MKSIIHQFTSRESGPLVQFIKYGICGGIATLVHVTIFFLIASMVLPALTDTDLTVRLLRHIGVCVTLADEAVRARNAMIDNFISFIFSNLTAYLMNIMWVFKPGRHSRIVEIGMFYAVSGVSMAIGTVVMGALIKSFGLTTTVAFGANVVTSVLINYVMRKFVIFKG